MRKDIWNDMLDADLNARYWGEQSRVAYSRDRGIRIILALTSSGGAIAGWTIWNVYPLAWQVLSAMTAVLAIASPILNYSGKAKSSTMLYCTWSDILRAYEILWHRIENNLLNNPAKVISEYNRIMSKEKQCEPHEAKYQVDYIMLKKCRQNILKCRGLI